MTNRYALAVIRGSDLPVVAVEIDGAYYPLSAVVPDFGHDPQNGVMDLIADWPAAHSRLSDAVRDPSAFSSSKLAQPEPVDFEPPVPRPGKVICCGVNYWDHLRIDMKVFDFEKAAHDPLFFMKHTGAVVGSGPSVRYPSQSRKLDWEVELVAVLGKVGHRIDIAEAADHVAGYCVGIDLSARDWQLNPRHLKQFDLLAGKAFDDSAPIGPHFVPAAFVDPSNLALFLSVNGEQKQQSDTAEMIWSVDEQVSHLSQMMTLVPGDLLFTGSPSGVGFPSNTFLKEGDLVEAEVQGLGRLSIEIIADPDAARAIQPSAEPASV